MPKFVLINSNTVTETEEEFHYVFHYTVCNTNNNNNYNMHHIIYIYIWYAWKEKNIRSEIQGKPHKASYISSLAIIAGKTDDAKGLNFI